MRGAIIRHLPRPVLSAWLAGALCLLEAAATGCGNGKERASASPPGLDNPARVQPPGGSSRPVGAGLSMANPQLETYSPEGVVQRLSAERLEADATLSHLVLTQPKLEGAGLIKGLNSAGWTLSAAHATWDRSGGTFVLDGGIVAGAGPLRFEGESLEIELTAATVPVAQRIKSSEPVALELSGAGIDAGRIQFEVEEGRIWLGDGVVVHDGLLERSVGELEWWPETGRLKCVGCPDHWWPEGWKE